MLLLKLYTRSQVDAPLEKRCTLTMGCLKIELKRANPINKILLSNVSLFKSGLTNPGTISKQPSKIKVYLLPDERSYRRRWMLWGCPSRAEQGVSGGHQVAGLRRLHDLAMVKNIQKLNQKMYLFLIKTIKA